MPLSSILSPLLHRGERKEKHARRIRREGAPNDSRAAVLPSKSHFRFSDEALHLCVFLSRLGALALNPTRLSPDSRCKLKGVPTVGADEGADDLPPSFQRHVTPVFLQLASGHRINAIAFTEGGPVQAVGLVEQHFVILRRPGRALRRAVQYFDKLLAPSARRMRNHHHRMRAPAQVGFINLPGGHGLAPLRAAARKALNAPRPTVPACLSSRP